MTEKIIDLIIPAYKSQITIVKTLASVLEQSISDKVRVTIINDCDEIGYNEIVEYYRKYLDIQYITLPNNRGPGIARQVGLDNTSCQYIAFADADDTFYSPYALQMLLQIIEESKTCSMVIAKHYLALNRKELKFVGYAHNFVWMFAKIYRRSFIEKYNIKFPDSRANEDVGFNQSIALIAISEEEKPLFLDEVVYCWNDNPNSITRMNENFVFNENFSGYVDNTIYAIHKAQQVRIQNKHQILNKIITTMADIYVFWEESHSYKPEFGESNFKASVKFYHEFFELIELTQDSSFINKIVLEELKNKTETTKQFIPEMTFHQFIDKIRKAEYEEN